MTSRQSNGLLRMKTSPVATTEDADVGVHTHHDHMVDLPVRQETEELLTVVRDGVLRAYLDHGMLSGPRV